MIIQQHLLLYEQTLPEERTISYDAMYCLSFHPHLISLLLPFILLLPLEQEDEEG